MAQYIDKAAATSVCNQQRAYGTMQGIQQLPAAKVVDREQFNAVANEIGESDEWMVCDKMILSDFVNRLEEKLFGGETK